MDGHAPLCSFSSKHKKAFFELNRQKAPFFRTGVKTNQLPSNYYDATYACNIDLHRGRTTHMHAEMLNPSWIKSYYADGIRGWIDGDRPCVHISMLFVMCDRYDVDKAGSS
jgi:hypothetical protein